MSQIQEDYEKVLRPYLANADAYQPLAKFVQSIKKPADFFACMTRYFLVTKDLGPKETRSLSAFYDLSAALLSKGTVYDGLRYETLAVKSDTLWHDRYAALNEKSRQKLDKQIKFLKATLTPTQKQFVRIFEAHMKKPDDKSFGEWLGKLAPYPLQDCLKAYIEVSQQYKDTDKNSLKIFYAMSFRTLGRNDQVFAVQYETSIKSDGSPWKRRYDALEWWQKEKIDEAIKDGKKIKTTLEYKLKPGRRYEGENFVLEESKEDPGETIAVPLKQDINLTVPKEEAQPADQLRKQPETDAQKKFREEFIAFMKRAPNDKRNDEFMRSIPRLKFEEVRQCLHTYLTISVDYGNDARSIAVFFIVAGNALEKGDSYYALKFKLNIGRSETIWAKRYLALNPQLKAQIDGEILKKEKSARFIHTLKFTYFQKYARDPDLSALRDFEINLGEEKELLLSKALEKCNHAYDHHSFEDFKAGFDSLTNLLKAETDLLLIYAIYQRCGRAPGFTGTLRLQIRWYVAGALYLLALVQRAKAYDTGLSEEEKQFLFTQVDRQNYYFGDFVLRLDYLWLHKRSLNEFAQVSQANLLLLMYADSVRMTLVARDETALVRALVEAIRKKKPEYLDKLEIPVSSGSARKLRIGETIGRIFIVYWDVHEPNDVYVEMQGFEGILFNVSGNRMQQVVADEWYGKVYEGTKHLLELIPLFFEILGFIPDLVSGGLTGLAKSIVFTVAFDKTIQALGIDATTASLVVLGVGLMGHGLSAAEKPHTSAQAIEGTAVNDRALGMAAGDTAVANRHVGDPSIGSNGLGGGSKVPLDPDFEVRGIRRPEGVVEIRGEGDVEVLPSGAPDVHGTSGRRVENPSVIADGVTGQATSATAVADSSAPRFTRQDLANAEDRLKVVKADLEKSTNAMERAKDRVGDIESNLESAQGKRFQSRLEDELKAAKQTETDAIAKYRESKAKVTGVERQVVQIRRDLASRGELIPSLGNEWNLPDNPVKYRKGTVEVESWDSRAFLPTSRDREGLEQLLNVDPASDMSKALLNNGKLHNPQVGNAQYWKDHPELIEMAHVLSDREGGRQVCIVMTKSRNRTFSARQEQTGGVFKDDAIVIDGIVIDRLSAMQLVAKNKLPADALKGARVIKFEKR